MHEIAPVRPANFKRYNKQSNGEARGGAITITIKCLPALALMLALLALCAACERNAPDNSDQRPSASAGGDITGDTPNFKQTRPTAPKKLKKSGVTLTLKEPPRKDTQTTVPILRISGNVIQPNGQPAPETDMYLYTLSPDDISTMPWQLAATARTNSTGQYMFETRTHNNWATIARKSGYAVAAKDYGAAKKVLRSLNEVHVLDFALKTESSYSGRILNASNAPVAGAHILATGSSIAVLVNQLNTYTDAEGRFTLRGIDAGKIEIAVAPPDGPVELFTRTAPDNNAEILLSKKAALVNGHLISDDADLTSLAVTVKATRDCPLAGLNLIQTANLDSTAAFQFEKLAPSQLQLSIITKPPNSLYLETETSGTIIDSLSLNLEDVVSTTVMLYVTGGKTLRGIVLDNATSQPLAGVQLYPDETAKKENRNFVTTTATGEFQLPHVSIASYVQVLADNFYLLSPKTNERLSTTLDQFTTITMARSPWLRGTVTSDSGGPVVGTSLVLYNNYNSREPISKIPVGVDGQFAFAISPGIYKLIAQSPGYASAILDDIELTKDGINGIDLILNPGRSAMGKVVNSNGQPIPDVSINAFIVADSLLYPFSYSPKSGISGLGEQVANTRSNSQGFFKLSLLPTTSHLAIVADGRGYAQPDIYAMSKINNSKEAILFTLVDPTDMYGSVVDETGKPLDSVTIKGYVSRTPRYLIDTISSTSGTFTLANVPLLTSMTIVAQREGYNSYYLSTSTTDSPVSITLSCETTSDLTISCEDIKSGKPVDAEITMNPVGGKPNAQQPIKLKNKPGQYFTTSTKVGYVQQFTAKAEGYQPYTAFIELKPDQHEITIRMRMIGKAIGRVVDEKHSPIANAKIVDHYGEVICESQLDGRFELDSTKIHRRYYAVLGEKSSTSFQILNLSGENDLGDVVLYSPSHLIVRVLKGENEPASGVEVQVRQNPRMAPVDTVKGETGTNGEFTIPRKRQNNLLIELPDYDQTYADENETDLPGKDRVVTFHIGDTVLRGRLLLDGQPVAGYVGSSFKSSALGGTMVSCGSDGRFEFKHLTAGEYKFSFAATGSGKSGSTSIILSDSDSVVEKDFNVYDQNIVGLVTDENDSPVPNANITVDAGKTHFAGKSGDDGRFATTVIDRNAYRVWAQKEGVGRSDSVTVSIPETGNSEPVTLRLKSAAGSLTCNVLSILDGLPMQNASAKLLYKNGQDFNGSKADDPVIIFKDLAPGDYQLVVTATGYTEARRSVTLEAGQNLEVTDVLSPASSVTVIITDANGYFVPGVSVALTPLDSNSVESPRPATTDDQGAAEFPGVLYGNYDVRATSPAGTTAHTIISTRNQQTQQVRLTLP